MPLSVVSAAKVISAPCELIVPLFTTSPRKAKGPPLFCNTVPVARFTELVPSALELAITSVPTLTVVVPL